MLVMTLFGQYRGDTSGGKIQLSSWMQLDWEKHVKMDIKAYNEIIILFTPHLMLAVLCK